MLAQLDIEPDPREPKLVKTIDEKTLSYKARYLRPHAMHCGPGLRPPHVIHVVVGNRLRFFAIERMCDMASGRAALVGGRDERSAFCFCDGGFVRPL
jgi:hypothetical protein